MDEDRARELAMRAVDRLGGVDALQDLFKEAHEPYPEHEFIIEDQRVFVRLRDEQRPPTIYVGPYTFELRDRQLVKVSTA